MPLNPIGNWYQQFLPNIGSRKISDVLFIDSLTGWAVTPYRFQNDTTFVMKTTTGGDSWFIQFVGTGQFVGRNRILFINANTGFTCGNDHYTGSGKITKTTNGGNNWLPLNDPTTAVYNDMAVLNENTIWLVASSSLTGGVFFTTTGGSSWVQQFSGGNQNPNKIYMYNARIGFISNTSAGSPNIYKTTNGGINWNINLPGEYFVDMHFTDSLTGWKSMYESTSADTSVKKTTNGGVNWVKQKLPSGGIIITPQITSFSFINKDTIWGAGGQVFYGAGKFRGVLYRTTNGGTNWLLHIPDTSYDIQGFGSIQFVNRNIGWAHSDLRSIHTTNGGDTTFLTGIQQISGIVPNTFELFQNYPNPFNPVTNIEFSVPKSAYVKLTVYDITGRQLNELINSQMSTGSYKIDFDASQLSSGIYFYTLETDGFSQTKKMMLIK